MQYELKHDVTSAAPPLFFSQAGHLLVPIPTSLCATAAISVPELCALEY